MAYNDELKQLVKMIRPALQGSTEGDRTKFVYDAVHEVYDMVKFDVHGPIVDAPERNRIGEILNAALPPLSSGGSRAEE